HIEQGPALEAEGVPLGVAGATAGQSRALSTFTGAAGRARTAPVSLRRAALGAAAALVTAVAAAARGADGVVAAAGGRQGPDGALVGRCAGGVGHSPAESVAVGDVAAAIEATTRFLELVGGASTSSSAARLSSAPGRRADSTLA